MQEVALDRRFFLILGGLTLLVCLFILRWGLVVLSGVVVLHLYGLGVGLVGVLGEVAVGLVSVASGGHRWVVIQYYKGMMGTDK